MDFLMSVYNRYLAWTEKNVSMYTFNILQHIYIQVTFPNSMPNTVKLTIKGP